MWMGHGTSDYESPAERIARCQRALNEHWPPPAIARSLTDRSDWIAVWARVVWERDGEEWLPGRATRWDRRHVFVRINDGRLQIPGVWLLPADVRRQEAGAPPAP